MQCLFDHFYEWPFRPLLCSSAFLSSKSKSTLFAVTLSLDCMMFIFEGVMGESALFGLVGDALRFSLSKASNSEAENCLACFGLNGTGVDTRDVRNCNLLVSSRLERVECTHRAGGTQQRNQRSLNHIFMDSNTPDLLMRVARRTFYIRGCFYVSTATDGVLLVVSNIEIDAQGMESIGQGRNSTVSDTNNRMLSTIDSDDTSKLSLGR